MPLKGNSRNQSCKALATNGLSSKENSIPALNPRRKDCKSYELPGSVLVRREVGCKEEEQGEAARSLVSSWSMLPKRAFTLSASS